MNRGLTLRRLALLATACVLMLVVAGNVVRVSGNGGTCPDWPLCYGRVLPFENSSAIIEVTHRVLAVFTSAIIVVLAALCARWHASRGLKRLALVTLVLMAAQIALGALLPTLGRRPWLTALHLTAGHVMLGVVTAMVVSTLWPQTQDASQDNPATKRYRRSFTTLAVLVFGLMLSGTLISGNNAALVCGPTFPACNGAFLPGGDRYTLVQWIHRAMVFVVGAMLLSVVGRGFRRDARLARPVRVALISTVGLYVVQGVAGWLMVALNRPAFMATLHSALSGLMWMTTIATAMLATRLPVFVPQPVQKSVPAWRQTLADYVTLTKPKVISLLLFTTLAGMFLTNAGMPPWHLVLWTMIGGYLMAGGANAVNMAYDTDIDNLMGRTSKRPTAAGRISRRNALAFGLALALTSFAIFAVFVNWLSAALAVLGFLYYTVIYTRWLKRSTWQNIVIGGGAGAIPPLIGWAAASGTLTLSAIILFVIVFYWTPPHFWALALMKRKDYAAAGVPMLPVVAGEAETTRQMVIYSLGMVAITLVLVPLRAMGAIYLMGAIGLGAWFLWLAWQVNRLHTQQAALKLYVYSLLYLFALFGVMMIDRVSVWI